METKCKHKFRSTPIVEPLRGALGGMDKGRTYAIPSSSGDFSHGDDCVWIAHVGDMPGLDREFVILLQSELEAGNTDKLFVGFARTQYALAVVDIG